MTFMFPVQEYLLVGPTVHSSDNKFWKYSDWCNVNGKCEFSEVHLATSWLLLQILDRTTRWHLASRGLSWHSSGMTRTGAGCTTMSSMSSYTSPSSVVTSHSYCPLWSTMDSLMNSGLFSRILTEGEVVIVVLSTSQFTFKVCPGVPPSVKHWIVTLSPAVKLLLDEETETYFENTLCENWSCKTGSTHFYWDYSRGNVQCYLLSGNFAHTVVGRHHPAAGVSRREVFYQDGVIRQLGDSLVIHNLRIVLLPKHTRVWLPTGSKQFIFTISKQI